jgi:hypothetical protein
VLALFPRLVSSNSHFFHLFVILALALSYKECDTSRVSNSWGIRFLFLIDFCFLNITTQHAKPIAMNLLFLIPLDSFPPDWR